MSRKKAIEAVNNAKNKLKNYANRVDGQKKTVGDTLLLLGSEEKEKGTTTLHEKGSVWVKVVDDSLDDKDVSLRYYTNGVSGRPDKEETYYYGELTPNDIVNFVHNHYRY